MYGARSSMLMEVFENFFKDVPPVAIFYNYSGTSLLRTF